MSERHDMMDDRSDYPALYPEQAGGPTTAVINFEKQETPLFDEPPFEGELIDRGSYAPPVPRSRKGLTRTVTEVAANPTAVGIIKAGLNVAAPIAEKSRIKEQARADEAVRIDTDPVIAVAKRDAERSKTKRWIAISAIGATLVGGGIATVVYGIDKVLTTGAHVAKDIAHDITHFFDESHKSNADAIVQTALSNITLDKDLALIDGTGYSTVALKQHGTVAFTGFNGNWHHADTDYNATLQIDIGDVKKNIKYTSMKNADGSYSLVATFNPQALTLKTINPSDVTVSHHGPLTGDDPREGKASSNLAQASFENQCSPVVAGLIPDALAFRIKESQTATEQQIEALPVSGKEKEDVIAAFRKMLAKPIVVHALADSVSGDRPVSARSVNYVPIINAAARYQAAHEMRDGKPAPRPFLLSQDDVAPAIGLSKETKQLDLKSTASCNLTPEAASELSDIKSSGLVADETAGAPIK